MFSEFAQILVTAKNDLRYNMNLNVLKKTLEASSLASILFFHI